MAFKVVIAGGRDFGDLKRLTKVADNVLRNQKTVEVVSGTARGADRLGEAYAYSRGFAVKRFPADWDTHGKSAGVIRNAEMAAYADAAIIFWDGQSRGTKNMIDQMEKIGKPYIVKKYESAATEGAERYWKLKKDQGLPEEFEHVVKFAYLKGWTESQKSNR